MAEGRYKVILADPPWSYRRVVGHSIASDLYPTMRPSEIAALPVGDLAADNAALFLWATFPMLTEALDVMRAWRFQFRTAAFVWVKTARNGTPRIGLGSYTRANAEVCLLGIRGRMRRKKADVRQIIMAQPRGHSRKPDEQYGRIARLFDGPYLECFARQVWPGWKVAFSDQSEMFSAQPYLVGELGA